MVSIKIIGSKGNYTAVPFQINSIDTVPEAIAEEENIINSSASDSDNQEESQVADDAGN